VPTVQKQQRERPQVKKFLQFESPPSGAHQSALIPEIKIIDFNLNPGPDGITGNISVS